MNSVNAMDSELPGAAPRLMASGTTGSSPVESASACRGLGSHGLVVTSDVTKRDPGHVAQWQSGSVMRQAIHIAVRDADGSINEVNARKILQEVRKVLRNLAVA